MSWRLADKKQTHRMNRVKRLFLLFLLAPLALSWQPLQGDQSGAGLELPAVIVVGQDRARLEGFREFGLLPELVPGIKLKPATENLVLSDQQVTLEPDWRTASGQAPGCAYRNPVTASLARGLGGVEAYYRSGRQKYLEGLYSEAESFFLTGLRKYPQSALAPDLHYWLGEIAFQREDMTEAKRHFQEIGGVPGALYYHYACYSLGWIAYRASEYAGAASWFERVSGSREERLRAAALFWQGEARLRLGEGPAAEGLWRQLIDAYPDSPEFRPALYRLATQAFNRHDYQASLSFLERIPSALSGSDELWRQASLARGWSLYFLQRWSEAEKCFAGLFKAGIEPVKTDEVQAAAFLGEVVSLLRQELLDQAAKLIESRPLGLRRAPAAAAAIRELRDSAAGAGNQDKAREAGRQLLTEIPPELLRVEDFRRQARLEVENRDCDSALSTLATGLQTMPDQDHPLLLLEKAQVWLRCDQPLSAEELLLSLFVDQSRFASEDYFTLYLLLARAQNRNRHFAAVAERLSPLPAGLTAEQQADLLYERGWAALQSGDYENALRDFSGFLGSLGKPESLRANAELNRIEALFNLHRDQEAIGALREFLKVFPDHDLRFRALNYLGLLHLRQGEFNLAAEGFSALLAEGPEKLGRLRPQVMFNLGESLYSLERFAEAAELFTRLINQYPEAGISGPAAIRVGESYFNQGEYLKSRLAYLKARQTWPDGEIEEKACYGLLLLAYNQDNYDYLEVEVPKFLARFPASSYTVPLLQLLADLYQRLGRHDDLLALYRELETGNYADDLKLEACFRHFRYSQDQGDRVVAAALCHQILERFPFSKYECDCRLYLARGYFAKADYQATADTLGGLESVCPDPDLRRAVELLRGRLLQVRGDYEAAAEAYLKVAKSSENDPPGYAALTGLAEVFSARGDFVEALFFYDKAVRNPDRQVAAEAALARARTLEKADRIADAEASYLRISYLFPEQKTVLAQALLAAARLADPESADRGQLLKKIKNFKLSPEQEKILQKIVEEKKPAD